MDQSLREQLQEYRDRLMGLIPPERISRVKFPRPSSGVVQGFKELTDPTPTLSDILDVLGVHGVISGSVLSPLLPDRVVVGPAVTLRYGPERLTTTKSLVEGATAKLADRDAYALAEPGDVAVIAAGGVEVSAMGGLSTVVALQRGLAGSIVDGGVRDVGAIRQKGYPVWCRFITPRSGKFRLEAMEINGVVDCAGVQVEPGDLVVADASGVVIVPRSLAEQVLRLAREATVREERVVELIERGASVEEIRRVLPPSRW